MRLYKLSNFEENKYFNLFLKENQGMIDLHRKGMWTLTDVDKSGYTRDILKNCPYIKFKYLEKIKSILNLDVISNYKKLPKEFLKKVFDSVSLIKDVYKYENSAGFEIYIPVTFVVEINLEKMVQNNIHEWFYNMRNRTKSLELDKFRALCNLKSICIHQDIGDFVDGINFGKKDWADISFHIL